MARNSSLSVEDYSFSSYSYDRENCTVDDCIKERSQAGPIGVAILSLFGLVGNISIIYLVIRHKKLRNAPNILIINLTIGDLLYIIFSASYFIEKEISPSWNAGLWTCKMKAYLEDAGQGVCVFSLAALSRERYLAIVCGIETRRRRGSCSANSLCAVAVVLTTAFFMGIPSMVFANMTSSNHCDQLPKPEISKKLFVSLRFLLGYVLPLCIVGYYYVRIANSLYRSIEQFGNSESHAHQSRLRKRLAIIVLLITVFFAIFWLPNFVHLHARAYSPIEHILLLPYPSYLDFLRIVGFLMALTNSCVNPWIVFVMSSKHRQHCWLFRSPCSRRRYQRGQGATRLMTLTGSGTTRRTSANVSQVSHV